MRCLAFLICFCAILFSASVGAAQAYHVFGKNEKPRVIVLTDISSSSGDPDDKQSLVRFLLYANEFDIEGLIASSACIRRKSNETGEPSPIEIENRVRAYGKVLPNLRLHSKEYPSEEYLLSIIKKGMLTGRKPGSSSNANGWPIEETIGKNKDTEASNLIIQSIDKDDDRPLWICVWGGPMDLAQALWRIRKDRSKKELAKAIAKLRVYAWGHQDLGGQWIRDNFPDLFYINSTAGIIYNANPYLRSVSWLETHVRKEHGALGELYPIRDPGIGEGDTETYLGLIPNGLSFMEHPDWGGWGGRMKPDIDDPNMWVDLTLEKSFKDANTFERLEAEEHSKIDRWAPEFQNDFQARMDWCVKDFEKANHPPQVVVNGDSTLAPIYCTEKAGEKMVFDAGLSRDPDGDLLFYHWFVYDEVSTVKGVQVTHEKKSSTQQDGYASKTPEWEKAVVTLPEGETGVLHLILACTDYGYPALTRYRRIVIKVE
ncbi:nucleoside hydrolase-like domain-containing protein [Plebeiibacterium marinum]|uniref:DUF1593 domain-containing protein n=1 Tax=Plebeiibacterium marinum TaxID=2992111 RepID=A0AAE3SIK2_9BACT|nr:nucleoside hydrolase-like domain-containing protein [Plebeiobacterium marinum]MCW3804518.1 DUF1593 domain-containing protein [Plebeiobacterium marinum]